MKLVALTQRVYFDVHTGERRDALDQSWCSFLQRCNITVLILPSNVKQVESLLKRVPIDGILLTGGNSHCSYGGDAQERDGLDAYLIGYQEKMNIPLLGVCRGMQSIQIKYDVKLSNIKGHVALNHIVIDEFGCKREDEVNSFHELGAYNTHPALKIIYKTVDGVIEAIQHQDKKIAGIMWHPERCRPYNENDIIFFKSFYNSETTI